MLTKKKVLYVITKSVWGGAQKYIYDLATGLSKDEFETAVAVGGTGPLTEKLTEAGVRVIVLPVLQKSNAFSRVLLNPVNLRALFSLLRIYREERPDMIHLNSSKIGGIGAVAARLASLVIGHWSLVIFTVHGWGFKEPRSWWQKSILFFFSWLSSLFHDKVILINTADYRTAQKFIAARKLALIHNGIGQINFFPREEARAFLAQKIGRPITSDTILIGTNAELAQNKGLEHLLRGLASCLTTTRLSLVFLVMGEGQERQRLEELITTEKIQDRAYLLGFISEAARYLKGFDIFALPSLKEGLPYTIMEAMAAGLPVVSTRVGGIPDLIEHEKDGILVPPAEHHALENALAGLHDPKRRASLGMNAQEKLRSRFRLKDMVQKTTELYLQ